MALLNDRLSVWEIAFRWADYDPDKFWIRIPLPVRDNFRCMINAILFGHLECSTLILEKWGTHPDPEFDRLVPPKDHIHPHIENVFAIIKGQRFNRKLLRHAVIERDAMLEWCNSMKIELPEFWFPKDMDWEYKFLYTRSSTEGETKPDNSLDEKKPRNLARQRIKMACQQIALALWSKNPKLTNKEIAITNEIQQLGGGSEYELETVQGWLSEVDPRDPTGKRGPKRKSNSGLDIQEWLQPSEN